MQPRQMTRVCRQVQADISAGSVAYADVPSAKAEIVADLAGNNLPCLLVLGYFLHREGLDWQGRCVKAQSKLCLYMSGQGIAMFLQRL